MQSDVGVKRDGIAKRFEPRLFDDLLDECRYPLLGGGEDLEIVDTSGVCRFHAVASHQRGCFGDGWIVWCRASGPSECRGPCCGVGRVGLDESDEVMVDAAGYYGHVVVGVVEDWEENSVMAKMLSSDGWPTIRGCISTAFASSDAM